MTDSEKQAKRRQQADVLRKLAINSIPRPVFDVTSLVPRAPLDVTSVKSDGCYVYDEDGKLVRAFP